MSSYMTWHHVLESKRPLQPFVESLTHIPILSYVPIHSNARTSYSLVSPLVWSVTANALMEPACTLVTHPVSRRVNCTLHLRTGQARCQISTRRHHCHRKTTTSPFTTAMMPDAPMLDRTTHFTAQTLMHLVHFSTAPDLHKIPPLTFLFSNHTTTWIESHHLDFTLPTSNFQPH